jgi:aryl-alcohol dehydrogenase-like predicted oxidoreductase
MEVRMEYVKFGTTDYRVSRIGLGCMSMSGCYGAQDDDECVRTIHRALELGVNFLDTSHSYGEGHNQELIGRALKGRRNQVVIHSKTGSPRTKKGDAINRGGGSADHLRKTCEESLQRLGTDHLDILCMSRVDKNVPIEESVGAMAKMVEEGKTRHIALSEASPESIRRAWAVHPIVSLQIEYSLFSRDAEEFGNLDAVKSRGMSLMAYSPLGKGILSGAFLHESDLPAGDRRLETPRFQGSNMERNAKLIARLKAIAQEKGASLPALALAWLLAQGKEVIPIPSSKSRDHLEDNRSALEIKLSPDDLARINAIVPAGAAAGTRYPEQQMSRLNV